MNHYNFNKIPPVSEKLEQHAPLHNIMYSFILDYSNFRIYIVAVNRAINSSLQPLLVHPLGTLSANSSDYGRPNRFASLGW